MQKWWVVSQLCWLSVLLLSACGAQESSPTAMDRVYNPTQPGAGYVTYHDEEGRFQLAYPEAWFVVQEAESTNEVYFIDPSLGGKPHQAIVGVIVQEPIRNPQRVADAADRHIRTQEGVKDFKVLEERTVQVNELKGIERTVNYLLNDYPLTQRTIYLLHKSNTFVLSFTTPDGNVERYTPVFDDIIRSFTVL